MMKKRHNEHKRNSPRLPMLEFMPNLTKNKIKKKVFFHGPPIDSNQNFYYIPFDDNIFKNTGDVENHNVQRVIKEVILQGNSEIGLYLTFVQNVFVNLTNCLYLSIKTDSRGVCDILEMLKKQTNINPKNLDNQKQIMYDSLKKISENHSHLSLIFSILKNVYIIKGEDGANKEHDQKQNNEKHHIKSNLYRNILYEILNVLSYHVQRGTLDYNVTPSRPDKKTHGRYLLEKNKILLMKLTSKFLILRQTNNLEGFFKYVINYFTFIVHQSVFIGLNLDDGVYSNFDDDDKIALKKLSSVMGGALMLVHNLFKHIINTQYERQFWDLVNHVLQFVVRLMNVEDTKTDLHLQLWMYTCGVNTETLKYFNQNLNNMFNKLNEKVFWFRGVNVALTSASVFIMKFKGSVMKRIISTFNEIKFRITGDRLFNQNNDANEWNRILLGGDTISTTCEFFLDSNEHTLIRIGAEHVPPMFTIKDGHLFYNLVHKVRCDIDRNNRNCHLTLDKNANWNVHVQMEENKINHDQNIKQIEFSMPNTWSNYLYDSFIGNNCFDLSVKMVYVKPCERKFNLKLIHGESKISKNALLQLVANVKISRDTKSIKEGKKIK
jgi:hypothetical protein